MEKIEINIGNLIKFYDEDEKASKHSNAIKAVAGEELCLMLAVEYLGKVMASMSRY